MKTQMRSRWEIFEDRRDKGGWTAEPEKDKDRKDQVTKNWGDTSKEVVAQLARRM